MSKYTRSSVESTLNNKRAGFHGRAETAKDAWRTSRKAVLDNPRLSEQAKRDDIAELDKKLKETLAGIREEEESYVRGLTSEVEKAMRGDQPTDSSSVLLRRDALDRVRNITTQREALEVLREAVQNGDDTLLDAIGMRGRKYFWGAVVEEFEAARPDVSGAADALLYLEGLTGTDNLAAAVGARTITGAAYDFPAASSVFDAPAPSNTARKSIFDSKDVVPTTRTSIFDN